MSLLGVIWVVCIVVALMNHNWKPIGVAFAPSFVIWAFWFGACCAVM